MLRLDRDPSHTSSPLKPPPPIRLIWWDTRLFLRVVRDISCIRRPRSLHRSPYSSSQIWNSWAPSTLTSLSFPLGVLTELPYQDYVVKISLGNIFLKGEEPDPNNQIFNNRSARLILRGQSEIIPKALEKNSFNDDIFQRLMWIWLMLRNGKRPDNKHTGLGVKFGSNISPIVSLHFPFFKYWLVWLNIHLLTPSS